MVMVNHKANKFMHIPSQGIGKAEDKWIMKIFDDSCVANRQVGATLFMEKTRLPRGVLKRGICKAGIGGGVADTTAIVAAAVCLLRLCLAFPGLVVTIIAKCHTRCQI